MTTFILQIIALTKANMRTRYRGTFAGFIWVIINPIALYLVQSIVFNKILRLNVAQYSIFLLGGLLPWVFLTLSVDLASGVFREKAEVIRSIKFNPLILPFSVVLDNFINFILGFALVLIPTLIISKVFHFQLLLLPIAFLLIFMFVTSLVVLIATLNCFYMDTRYFINFLFSLLFFATPIFYPKEFVPAEYSFIYKYNIIFPFIELFRQCVYRFEFNEFVLVLGKCALVLLFICPMTYYYFKSKKNAMIIRA